MRDANIKKLVLAALMAALTYVATSIVQIPSPMQGYVNLGFYTCTVSGFEQYTLAKFMAQGRYEQHLSRMKARYRQKRDTVIAMLRSSPLADRVEIMEQSGRAEPGGPVPENRPLRAAGSGEVLRRGGPRIQQNCGNLPQPSGESAAGGTG